ncbi:MAG: DNA-directed RNA polymerase subunit beta, partial [Malacoplasma sp.]
MNKSQNFIDKIITPKVVRRDYSKIISNFKEPNLLNLQKQSFKRFIDKDLEVIIKNFFPIKSIGGRYSLEYVETKIDKPKRTEKQARNEGKTYDRPLYVDLTIIDNESGEVKKTSKNKSGNSDGIFFANIPIMTEKGTFIVNGIEKFVISQIVRSPGPYILTKSQIKLSNSRKRIQEGYVCEILPYKGTLFFVFISENKKYVQIMFRDSIGESTCLVPITTFLKALGLNEKEILDMFDNNCYIVESLKFENYNRKNVLDEYISDMNKSSNLINSNLALSRSIGIDNKLRNLVKEYKDLQKDDN